MVRITSSPEVKAHPVLKRWAAFITVEGECWIWNGCRARSGGYPLVNYQGRSTGLHRLVCDHHYHPVTKYRVKQICCNVACVKPEHLVPIYASWRLLVSAVSLPSLQEVKR